MGMRAWRLVGVGAAALACGAVGAPMTVAGARGVHPVVVIVLGLAVGWSFAGVGLYAWWRRPDNRVGVLLTAVGFAWFASALGYSQNPLTHTVGLALSGLFYAVVAHLLLAFPSGRVTGRADRAVVVAAYAVAALGQSASLVFLDDSTNLLLVHPDHRWATGLLTGARLLGVAVIFTVTWLLFRRWRRADLRRQRKVISPVLWAGVVQTLLAG